MMDINMIYMVLNNITKDFYIGSTVNFDKRVNAHKRQLVKNKHHSRVLQRAYRKYGIKNFSYIKYIQCNNEDNLIIEQFCIDFLSPKYNIAKDSKAPMTGRKHSSNTKKLMSDAHKGNKYNLGKKRTKSQNKKRSLDRIGYKHSASTKLKMSNTAKRLNSILRIKNSRKKEVVDSLGNIFESISSAALYYNISKQTIVDILKGRHKKTRKKISFLYKENHECL